MEPLCIGAGGGGRSFNTTTMSSVSPGSIRDWDMVPDTIPTALGINNLSLNNGAVINTEQQCNYPGLNDNKRSNSLILRWASQLGTQRLPRGSSCPGRGSSCKKHHEKHQGTRTAQRGRCGHQNGSGCARSTTKTPRGLREQLRGALPWVWGSVLPLARGWRWDAGLGGGDPAAAAAAAAAPCPWKQLREEGRREQTGPGTHGRA